MSVTKRIILTLPVLLFACICLYALPAYALTPFSGLEVANSEKTPGARVFGVNPESPASRAGVQPGDVIVSIDGQDVKSLEDFVGISKAAKGKEKATVSLDRQGKLYNAVLNIKLSGSGQPGQYSKKQVQPVATRNKGGILGVEAMDATPQLKHIFKLPHDSKGALVIDVTTGSAADKAGIKRGDLIIEFNGEQVSTHPDLPRMVPALAPGTRVEVKFIREGRTENVQVVLGRAAGGQGSPAPLVPKKKKVQPKVQPKPQPKPQPKAQPEAQSPGDIDIPDDLGEL